MRLYYVYILASRLHRTLYIGVTGNLEQRLNQHRYPENKNCFTAKYQVTSLVYFEDYTDIRQAIAREKELKGWRRAKKIALIERLNPNWTDLAPPGPPDPSLTLGMT